MGLGWIGEVIRKQEYNAGIERDVRVVVSSTLMGSMKENYR